ncbi:MAG: M48 family metallopeptidase [Thermoanaerobaculia bacterium]
MDFFEHQEQARRSTARLVFFFVLAVITIIALTYVVVAGAISSNVEDTRFWNPLLLAYVAGAVVLIVSGGSLYKVSQLNRGGGASVAEMLGGRLLSQSSDDPVERRVLNVVEEMAIASGTPVPPVYLLPEEDQINAFAAGSAPEDAVLGITRGCATRLTRDQLQGVVAHEFSHVLNGDMRLNIRLMGVLHGILIIGIIGYFVMRLMFSGSRGRSRSRDKGGGAMVAILAIGVGLMVVGFAGTFFGNLIKAAVSRQREYLADASAVQFTRNPRGISSALQQLGAVGTAVQNPHAAEASHMFFGRAVVKGFNAMFATHPPLPDRIRRIDTSWDGSFPEPQPEWTGPDPESEPAAGEAGDEIDERDVLIGAAILPGVARSGQGRGQGAVSQVGQLDDAHLAYARELIRGLPRAIAEATREPYGARAVVYTMLIDRDEAIRRTQLERLAEHTDAELHALTLRLLEQADGLAPEARLPLLDMTAPSLRSLSRGQYEDFKRAVETLILADDKVDLFEWSLQRIILHRLEPVFTGARPPAVQYYALNRLAGPCALLLSTLAHQGHDDLAAAAAAFEAGRAALGVDRVALVPEAEGSLDRLGDALDVLVKVAPRLKSRLLQACAECIAADKTVTTREGELLRAVSDSLGCPMPPLLPGQPLA